MNATSTKTEPTVRTEWGVEKTWPDGHVEYKRTEDRDAADYSTWVANRADSKGKHREQVVTRTVTTTPWTPEAV